MAKSEGEVRVSLVEGTFFETLPTSDLLREVWRQLLLESGLPMEKTEEVVANLGSLGREEIAISRHISGASIKPRLRIMSEVEKEGNPHTYGEIPARTVNLVVKPAVVEESSPETDWLSQSVAWFQGQVRKEGVVVHHADHHSIVLAFGGEVIPFSIRCIHHLRNGRHLVVQYQI